jgi:hypothetical protein
LDEVPGGAACSEITSSSACIVPGLSPGCRFWAEIWFVALKNIEFGKGDVERHVGMDFREVEVIEHEMIGFGAEFSP